MKTFKRYFQERELGLGDVAGDEETCMMRLAKLVIKKHRQDFVKLLADLAQKDEEIRDEMESMRTKKPLGPDDSIVPPSPDSKGDDDIPGPDGSA